MLSIDELTELEDSIVRELPERITEILTRTNRTGELDELLRLLGLSDLLERKNKPEPFKNGKIVVVGATKVKEAELFAIGKQLGFGKKRFEFYLDYEAVKTHNFNNMLWEPTYAVILLGPAPHSGHGKGDSGSVIAELEKADGIPRVERLESYGQGLKITKTNFREKLQKLLDEKVIKPDLST